MAPRLANTLRGLVLEAWKKALRDHLRLAQGSSTVDVWNILSDNPPWLAGKSYGPELNGGFRPFLWKFSIPKSDMFITRSHCYVFYWGREIIRNLTWCVIHMSTLRTAARIQHDEIKVGQHRLGNEICCCHASGVFIKSTILLTTQINGSVKDGWCQEPIVISIEYGYGSTFTP